MAIMCAKCLKPRVINVSGKTSDMFSANFLDEEYIGYVPSDLNIGGGDYIHFAFCLECGFIQDKWPLPETDIEVEFREFKREK